MSVDGYERYYAEKLWELIPGLYRSEDDAAPTPGVLRAIVEVVAAQAAEARRSMDRLWEDQHIETCDDWAVPYIGDLVGTRPLPALDSRARRVDVARTVRYRRHRGTPDLLETLVRELSGWDVVLVEAFRRLARTAHRLDASPVAVGRLTRTPLGGTADLRNARVAELVDTAFDELAHTPDFRLLRGTLGRYNIRKLNFHLFRLKAFEVDGVDPVLLTDPGLATFTFDPSGRDVPLFARSQKPSSNLLERTDLGSAEEALAQSRCRTIFEWQVARAIPCRLLAHGEYELTLDILASLTPAPSAPTAALLRKAVGVRFPSEERLRRFLTRLGVPSLETSGFYPDLLRKSITLDSGKRQLYPNSVEVALDGVALERHEVTAGDLATRDCHPEPALPFVKLLISPTQGRLAPVLEMPEPNVPPADPDFVVQYVLPESLTLLDPAVYTNGGELTMTDGVDVLGPGGSGFGPLVCTSNHVLHVGLNADIGDVWSVGLITTGNNSHFHGDVTTSAHLVTSTGVLVDGTLTENVSIPTTTYTESVKFPAPGANQTINSLVTLTPGAYGIVNVNTSGTLRLNQPGRYYFEELDFGLNCHFEVDTGAGPILIYVRTRFEWHGTVTYLGGSPGGLRILYLGTISAFFHSAFSGCVVVPFTHISLQPAAAGFRGIYWGKFVSSQPNNVITQEPFVGWADVIDGIAFPPDVPALDGLRYHYGFPAEVGAGPYARDLQLPLGAVVVAPGAVIEPPASTSTLLVPDSRTRSSRFDATPPIADVKVLAASGQRPFAQLVTNGGHAARLVPDVGGAARLEMTGIWLGCASDEDIFVERSASPGSSDFDWDAIVLRECTLDPGGVRADGVTLPTLRLVVRGRVRKLLIERCILGPIEIVIADDADQRGFVERLEIIDSIVDATRLTPDADGRRRAITSGDGVLVLQGVTVLGDVFAEQAQVTDSIVMGRFTVADIDASCFRFSAASPGGRLPRLHQAFTSQEIRSSFFASLRFGDPTYGSVTRTAPLPLRHGAETGSEMGAFSHALRPIQLASVQQKVDELQPVGVFAQYVFEGESSAAE